MIEWEDVYKVVVAITPLYVALTFGYGSVKWWRILDPQQCEAINRMVYYFTYPFFVLEFTAHFDPFGTNFVFIGADVISKAIIIVALGCWAKYSNKGSYCWFITGFSLSTLTNSLVVGVPLLKAMYGDMAVDLVIQASVFQALVWLTTLLFVLETKQTRSNRNDVESSGGDMESVKAATSFWRLMKEVWIKMAKNPNSYACLIGITWAFFSNRWQFEMPSLIEGSILIMSRAGTGTAMFSLGLFMGSQEKVIACGATLSLVGMALKFIVGPLSMAMASLLVGLRGDVLRVAIIQAALPQSITSFIFAKEYGLHADVLSTAVIFGMFLSLPVLIGYYAVLEIVH